MKKTIVLAAALVLILVPLSLGAQTAESTEFQFLSFDIGYAPGWDFGGDELVTPALFGLNVRVADSFAVGFQTLNDGNTTDNYLILKYSFLPQLRAALGFGAQDVNPGPGTPASSLGIEIVPFTRSVGGLAATEFKVAIRYDSPFDNMVEGKILFTLAFGIGF
jgi:hypothetical protein